MPNIKEIIPKVNFTIAVPEDFYFTVIRPAVKASGGDKTRSDVLLDLAKKGANQEAAAQ